MPADPVDIDRLIDEAALRHNVDPRLVRAVMQVENRARNPYALGPVMQYGDDVGLRAMGLMQLSPSTARRLGVREPFDPAQNIDGGVKLLAQLLDRYGNAGDAVLAYHGGTDQSNWGTRTRSYLRNVTGAYRSLTPPQQVASAEQAISNTPARPSEVEDPDIAWAIGKAPDPVVDAEESDPTIRALIEADRRAATPKPRDTESTWSQIGTGLQQGLHDVIDPQAEWLAGKLEPYVARAARTLGLPTPPTREELVADDTARRHQFNADYQGSIPANIGRAGGSTVASAPYLLSGARVLGGAGRVASAPFNVGPRVAEAGRVALGAPGANTGSIPINALARATGGAVSGAGAGYLAADPDKPLGEQVQEGAAYGAGGNMLLTPMVAGTGRALRQMFAPPLDPRKVEAARRMGAQGVQVYGRQITDSPAMRGLAFVVNDIPGSGEAGRSVAQREQFTRSLLHRMGLPMEGNNPRLTPEVVQRALRGAWGEIERVAQPAIITRTPEFTQALSRIEQEAGQYLTDREFAPVWRAVQEANRAFANTPGRTPNGEVYLALTRHDAPLSRLMSHPDTNIAHYARQVRTALDSLLEQNISGEDLAALRRNRLYYRYAKTLEPEARDNPGGIADPARVATLLDDMTDPPARDLREGARLFLAPETQREAQSSWFSPRAAAVGLAGQALLFGQNPTLAAKVAAATAATTAGARAAGAGMASQAYTNSLLNPGVIRRGVNGAVRAGNRLTAAVNQGNPTANLGIQEWNGPEGDEAEWEMPPVVVEGTR